MRDLVDRQALIRPEEIYTVSRQTGTNNLENGMEILQRMNVEPESGEIRLVGKEAAQKAFYMQLAMLSSDTFVDVRMVYAKRLSELLPEELVLRAGHNQESILTEESMVVYLSQSDWKDLSESAKDELRWIASEQGKATTKRFDYDSPQKNRQSYWLELGQERDVAFDTVRRQLSQRCFGYLETISEDPIDVHELAHLAFSQGLGGMPMEIHKDFKRIIDSLNLQNRGLLGSIGDDPEAQRVRKLLGSAAQVGEAEIALRSIAEVNSFINEGLRNKPENTRFFWDYRKLGAVGFFKNYINASGLKEEVGHSALESQLVLMSRGGGYEEHLAAFLILAFGEQIVNHDSTATALFETEFLFGGRIDTKKGVSQKQLNHATRLITDKLIEIAGTGPEYIAGALTDKLFDLLRQKIWLNEAKSTTFLEEIHTIDAELGWNKESAAQWRQVIEEQKQALGAPENTNTKNGWRELFGWWRKR